jgi:YVTN family beta-propeller protein
MGRVLAAGIAVLSLLAGCAASNRAVRPPLDADGALLVYLRPGESASIRLTVSLARAWAEAGDGTLVPLELSLTRLPPEGPAAERLLAQGRLPPGSYRGLRLLAERATLDRDGASADLTVGPEPTAVAVPFAVARRRATVLEATFHSDRSVERGFSLSLELAAAEPAAAAPAVLGYVTATGADTVTAFDRHTRRVAAAIATGRGPEGLAFDPARSRAYLALSGEDQVAVLDLTFGEEIGRIPLLPGDEPGELGITPDGRTLLVANAGSATVSLVDPLAALELERFQVGEEPAGVLVEPAGRRAYVLSRRGASLTVVDLASRVVAATVATEAEPVRAALDRAGTRLYLAQAGSTELAVYALPGLELVQRLHVGLGARAVQVDPRTGLIFVAVRDEPALLVFDPIASHPVETIDLGGPASFLALDPAENALLALLPSPPRLVTVDLASGRPVARLEVGIEPYLVALPGDRR